MSSNQGRYIKVQHGDCIFSLSAKFGFDPETIINHPNNDSIRNLRKDPTQLVPGDEVYIPELSHKSVSGATEKRHRFKRKGLTTRLKLRFLDFDEPLADMPFTFSGGHHLLSGTTDENGNIDIEISATVKKAIITIGEAPDEFEFDILIGGMHPDDTVTGQQQRLSNLGLYSGNIDGVKGAMMDESIVEFKTQKGLEVNEALDAASLKTLGEEAGS